MTALKKQQPISPTLSPTLSILVVAHNEERHLEACLKLLGFGHQLVVVLDRCTDGSARIAKKYANRVLEGAWPVEGERRNTGIAACTGDWILEVDADERVGESLAQEILETTETSTHDWHDLPVDNYIGDRLVRYGWGASFGTTAVPRLFRKGAKVWQNQRVHPSLTFQGVKGERLKSPMDHYVDDDVTDMLDRFNRYTSARAEDLREKGIPETFRKNFRRLFTRFFKCYISRKGYKEGRYGFLISLLAGLYPLISYIKATSSDKKDPS